MRRWPLATLVGLVCFSLGCAARGPRPGPLPRSDPRFAELARLEATRSTGGGRLLELAAAPEAELRARAQLALARLQHPELMPPILSGLLDPAPEVRAAAAFAAGVLGLSWQPLEPEVRDPLASAVISAELQEGAGAPRAAQLQALGRIGGEEAQEHLAAAVRRPDPEIQAVAALALGVLARRDGALSDTAAAAPIGLLRPDADLPLRFAGAYALAHSRSAQARTALAGCLTDGEAEVRALCARGLAEVGTDDEVPALTRLLGDGDVRVAVEAARALARGIGRCEGLACAALEGLRTLHPDRLGPAAGGLPDAPPHLLLAVAQAGLPPSARPLLEALHGALRARRVEAAGREEEVLATLECRFAAALDRQVGILERSLDCGGGRVPERRRLVTALRELAQGPALKEEGAVAALLPLLHHPSPAIQGMVLEALGAAGAAHRALSAPAARPLLLSPDPLVQATAAATLATIGDLASFPAVLALAKSEGLRADVLPVLASALALLPREDAEPPLRRWLGHPAASVRHAAAQALSTLVGQRVDAPLRADPAPFAASREATPAGALRVRTALGEFRIRLDSLWAPLTSAHLTGLAERGFFDGLTFHRLVPAFVLQGGDPRGDGAGGPDHSVPCEVSPLPYRRGTVGMALSGKDTGGSQLFVALSPQPHLEGRYTVFGQVDEGMMELVERLLEGDVILQVRPD